MLRNSNRLPAFRGRGRLRHTSLGIKAMWICVPAQVAGGDSGDAEGDAVTIAEFGFAVGEQTDERSVDVAEAEEAEVEGRFQGFRVSKFQEKYHTIIQNFATLKL